MEYEHKCGSCGAIIENFGEYYVLRYQGLRLSLRVLNYCETCHEKSCIELIEQYRDKLLRQVLGEKGAEIEVDWEFYIETVHSTTYWGEKPPKELCEAHMNALLLVLGVFSESIEGNYEVFAAGYECNPPVRIVPLGPYYFTREKDAVAYAKARYRDDKRPVEIRHVDKIIKLEQSKLA